MRKRESELLRHYENEVFKNVRNEQRGQHFNFCGKCRWEKQHVIPVSSQYCNSYINSKITRLLSYISDL
jgi:hypothetical protein